MPTPPNKRRRTPSPRLLPNDSLRDALKDIRAVLAEECTQEACAHASCRARRLLDIVLGSRRFSMNVLSQSKRPERVWVRGEGAEAHVYRLYEDSYEARVWYHFDTTWHWCVVDIEGNVVDSGEGFVVSASAKGQARRALGLYRAKQRNAAGA